MPILPGSIPKMFGAHGQLVGDEKGMYPYETKEGIKIVSINLLMEDEEAPVVWRGTCDCRGCETVLE